MASTTMTVSEARAALPQVLDRVAEGDEVTITRHGRPVAVVVGPGVLRARRSPDTAATAQRLHQLMEEARDRPLSSTPALPEESADAIVAEIRAGREPRP